MEADVGEESDEEEDEEDEATDVDCWMKSSGRPETTDILPLWFTEVL